MNNISNEDNIEKSRVTRKTKDAKLKSISKKKVKLKSSNTIPGDNMRNDQKKYFKKKIEKDMISIQLSSSNSQISFGSQISCNSNSYYDSEKSSESNSHYKESNCYDRKVVNEL